MLKLEVLDHNSSYVFRSRFDGSLQTLQSHSPPGSSFTSTQPMRTLTTLGVNHIRSCYRSIPACYINKTSQCHN